MKPWIYVKAEKTDILARFKEMGWVPPSEAKSESIGSSNKDSRKPGSSGQSPGDREIEHKPLEAVRSGSSGSRPRD
jgi:hypothetical protein